VLQKLVRNRIAIVSSSWTAERSVAMRFGRPQSALYLILLTRHQIHRQPRKGCVWVAPWRSVLWCWLTPKGKMRPVMYVCNFVIYIKTKTIRFIRRTYVDLIFMVSEITFFFQKFKVLLFAATSFDICNLWLVYYTI
jgi:hypothetical protein